MVAVWRNMFEVVIAVLFISVSTAEDQLTNSHGSCISKSFACSNGQCIETDLVCNDLDNCGDNSDENNCEMDKAGYNHWITIFLSIAVILIGLFLWRYIKRRLLLKKAQRGSSNQTGYPLASMPNSYPGLPDPPGCTSTRITTDTSGYTPWTTDVSNLPQSHPPDYSQTIPSGPPPAYSTVVSESTIDPPFAGFTYNQLPTDQQNKSYQKPGYYT